MYRFHNMNASYDIRVFRDGLKFIDFWSYNTLVYGITVYPEKLVIRDFGYSHYSTTTCKQCTRFLREFFKIERTALEKMTPVAEEELLVKTPYSFYDNKIVKVYEININE